MLIDEFTQSTELYSQCAKKICQHLSHAIASKGQAYLVVSGGKSPMSLFERLASTELPWQQVTVLLADERCVDSQHEDSNEYLVRTHLLKNKAQDAQFIGLYPNIDKQINALPTFDVLILGMGEDGHTASLFPCSAELAQGLNEQEHALLLVNPKTAPYQRISMTKKRLANSQHVFLPLIGEKKRAVFDKALLCDDPMTYPISAFLNDPQINIHVYYANQ